MTKLLKAKCVYCGRAYTDGTSMMFYQERNRYFVHGGCASLMRSQAWDWCEKEGIDPAPLQRLMPDKDDSRNANKLGFKYLRLGYYG